MNRIIWSKESGGGRQPKRKSRYRYPAMACNIGFRSQRFREVCAFVSHLMSGAVNRRAAI